MRETKVNDLYQDLRDWKYFGRNEDPQKNHTKRIKAAVKGIGGQPRQKITETPHMRKDFLSPQHLTGLETSNEWSNSFFLPRKQARMRK